MRIEQGMRRKEKHLASWLNKRFSDPVFNSLPLFAWMLKTGRTLSAGGEIK